MTKLRQLRLGLAVCLACAIPAIASAQQAHTKWYLAEGNAGYFEEEILAVNPTAQAATGVVHVLRNGQAPVDYPFTLDAHKRRTVNVNTLLGAIGDASAVIDTSTAGGGNGVPIFVERTMYWNGRNAGHNSPALEAASTTWYLAEGAANGFFDCFILLANPNATAAHVTLTLQKDDGTVFPVSVTLAANSRDTVYVNQLAGFGFASFSTVITSDQAIFAERAMYWNHYIGGHDATAVPALSTVWRFAEGFTGSGYQTYFLVNNPSGADATVTLHFFLDTGATVDKVETVAAHSRKTVWANQYPELVNQAFGTVIQSSTPIVAERSMYWGNFKEGHGTAGLTQEANSFAFAEGLAGTHNGINYETFFLFMNSSDSPVDVRGTFYREDGYGTQQTFTIPAHARYTLYGASVPDMNNQKFGAFFAAVNTAQTFIAERAVYWGQGRYGGTVSTGTAWNDQIVAPPTVPVIVTPPPPPPPPVCDAEICDSLQGSTKGQLLGGAFDGFGFVATNPNAGIRYQVATITSGYFQMEVTGIRNQTDPNVKPKIMAMFDGDWGSSDPYRATAEKRNGDKGWILRFKFLSGSNSDYIETDGNTNWDPNEIYTFRMEWRPGFAHLLVTRHDGSVAFDIGGPAFTYQPAHHVLQVGNPDAGDHSTYVGMRVRNVKIGRN